MSLDPETPAILLTAGAGTGKTHTLAARLARLLGVRKRDTPTVASLQAGKEVPLTESGTRLDPAARLRAFEESHLLGAAARGGTGGGWGGGGGEELCECAASPESVLVLSFTNQVIVDHCRAMKTTMSRAHVREIAERQHVRSAVAHDRWASLLL